jgi:outer membrane protein assembly factor BamB
MNPSPLFPTLGALLLLMPALSAQEQAPSWPEWRGPTGQGHAVAADLPRTFDETSGVVWKTPLPGRGHSTPVIEGDRIWLTTAIETPASEEEARRRLEQDTGNQPLTVLASVSLRALCVDATSGMLLHDVELLHVDAPQWVHQLNSYASPSPIIRDGLLYAHFGSFGTACLDTRTSELLWTNQELEVMHENGPGATPVLWGDHLIAPFDGSDLQFIAAFDANTGKVIWQTPRSGELNDNPQFKKAYGSPLLIEQEGGPILVSAAADWIYAYDPASGKELWKAPYGELGFSLGTRPVADEDHIYIATSFGRPKLIAFRHRDLAVPEVAWENNKNSPKMSSPVIADGMIFYVDDGGIVTCVDCRSGDTHFRERLGGTFSASPIASEGRIWFASREGLVSVIPVAKTFQVESQGTLDGTIMASPVASGRALFIRTDQALYRLEADRP